MRVSVFVALAFASPFGGMTPSVSVVSAAKKTHLLQKRKGATQNKPPAKPPAKPAAKYSVPCTNIPLEDGPGELREEKDNEKKYEKFYCLYGDDGRNDINFDHKVLEGVLVPCPMGGNRKKRACKKSVPKVIKIKEEEDGDGYWGERELRRNSMRSCISRCDK